MHFKIVSEEMDALEFLNQLSFIVIHVGEIIKFLWIANIKEMIVIISMLQVLLCK